MECYLELLIYTLDYEARCFSIEWTVVIYQPNADLFKQNSKSVESKN